MEAPDNRTGLSDEWRSGLIMYQVKSNIYYRLYYNFWLDFVPLTWTTLMTQQRESGKVKTMRTMEMIVSKWAHIP